MYEAFFGLTRRPFVPWIEKKLVFATDQLCDALENSHRIIDRGEGIVLILGNSGVGKSVVCKLLGEALNANHHVILLKGGGIDDKQDLLRNLLYELHQPFQQFDTGTLRLKLKETLRSQAWQGALIILVDDAEQLNQDVLEELAAIHNFFSDGKTQIRLGLCGKPALEEHLNHPKLDSFNQRISGRFYLSSFSAAETADYITFQMEQVRLKPDPLFTKASLLQVHKLTDGIPRLVNQLCDHALLLAFSEENPLVSEVDIKKAWSDLQQLPADWDLADGSAADHAPPAHHQSDSEASANHVNQEPFPSSDSVIEFGELEDPLETTPLAELAHPPTEPQNPYANLEPADLSEQIGNLETVVREIDDICDSIDREEPFDEEIISHPNHPLATEAERSQIEIIAHEAPLEKTNQSPPSSPLPPIPNPFDQQLSGNHLTSGQLNLHCSLEEDATAFTPLETNPSHRPASPQHNSSPSKNNHVPPETVPPSKEEVTTVQESLLKQATIPPLSFTTESPLNHSFTLFESDANEHLTSKIEAEAKPKTAPVDSHVENSNLEKTHPSTEHSQTAETSASPSEASKIPQSGPSSTGRRFNQLFSNLMNQS